MGQSMQEAVAQDAGAGPDLAEAELSAIRDPALVEARREQLLDAALELFLKKGFASTTIRDICARSGINPASIYDYVANKQDILRRLLNRLWFRAHGPSLPDRLAAAPPEAFEAVLDAYFEEIWRDRRAGTLLAYRTVPHLAPEDRRMLREREERLLNALAARIRAHAGAAQDDPRAEVIANFIIFSNAFGPMRDWLTPETDDAVARRMVVAGVMGMIAELSEPPADPGGAGATGAA